MRGLQSPQSRITNHASRITNHESRITNHESRITNHESRITNHESRITNHESRITNQMHTMKRQLHFFLLTGWLIPAGVALIFFGRWITEILIPTLKGGNFEQLYDLH